MSVVVITPPEPIVSLAEAKAHVRFSAFDDDPYLDALVAAIIDYLDGPKGRLGRALGLQVLEERRHAFPGYSAGFWDPAMLALPLWCFDGDRLVVQVPPIVGVVSVTYADEAGADQVLPASSFAFDEDRLEVAHGVGGWPASRYGMNSVRVRYQAGYEVVPPAIKAAVLLMVGTLYANREASLDTAFAGAAENLLSPYAKVV